MGKRKRNRHGSNQPNRPRSAHPHIKAHVLAQYYPSVLTLREYLLSRLPVSSKARKKKIAGIGRRYGAKRAEINGKEDDIYLPDLELGRLLDQTMIGISKGASVDGGRMQMFHTFSERSSHDNSAQDIAKGIPSYCQDEIVDFSIWLLFQRDTRSPGIQSQHLLCQGFRKHIPLRWMNSNFSGVSAIPGVISIHPNSHVNKMKGPLWTQVLALLGRDGQEVMVELLVDCAIFVALDGAGNFHQLSGIPMGELTLLNETPVSGKQLCRVGEKAAVSGKLPMTVLRTPGSITFVRNRMLYAKASLNAHGRVRFGLRHIHALNRYPVEPLSTGAGDVFDAVTLNTLPLMMYLFPRQFGLHNVFTSVVDLRETVHPLKDYTMREEEINRLKKAGKGGWTGKCPKRLRGEIVQLVRKMQILHKRCAYVELLNHYCPTGMDSLSKSGIVEAQGCTPMQDGSSHDASSAESVFRTQASLSGTVGQLSNTVLMTKPSCDVDPGAQSSIEIPERKTSFLDHTTPVAQVSIFCCRVLDTILPNGFFGSDDVQKHNRSMLNRNIERFIRLRRFETLSLHEVVQEMKVTEISWLAPPKLARDKTSKTDIAKRLEIFYELVYYIFDSLLIPLLRSNFHITESQTHRHRIFFFRHDTWRSLTEPALAVLKSDMFEGMDTVRAQEILNSRPLGFSQVRLLPKATGVRPIMNLRRRVMKKGQRVLGPSINSILTPIHNMFNYEKMNDPTKLGSTLFSVGDIYPRLRVLKEQISTSKPLYFAKVDVQAAFDTIPQSAIIKFMNDIPTSSSYNLSRHIEIKSHSNSHHKTPGNPIRKFVTLAKPTSSSQTFDSVLRTLTTKGAHDTVYVDKVVPSTRATGDLLSLMQSHIQTNIVKIGKKFYRQKRGIPQGSVLSSLLCNYFYADLERTHLSFLHGTQSTLFRLIDDFLLITTDRTAAARFLAVMHAGAPEYGVSISPAKSLTNFEVSIHGVKIPRLVGTTKFPYVGTLIDTRSLDISRDPSRLRTEDVPDSLTVEFSKRPGATFHRKVLNAFKMSAHAMFLDTSLNSVATVLANLYRAFEDTARKMLAYWRELRGRKRPRGPLVAATVRDLVELACALCRRRRSGFRFDVGGVAVRRVAYRAVGSVVGGRTGWEGWSAGIYG